MDILAADIFQNRDWNEGISEQEFCGLSKSISP